MTEVGTYFFTYRSPSASVRGWESGPNQGSDRGSTPRNESFHLPSTSPGHGGVPPASTKDSTTFKCPACPKRFIQERGAKRHYDEKHRPDLLIPCLGDGGKCNFKFKWTRSRKSECRNHLKKKHGLKDDEIDKKLGGPARRRRRRDRVIESNLPPHLSPPPIERDRQSSAEAQQRPLMPPLLAVGKDAHHASPPLTPSVAYHPRLGHAEPEATTTDHEDSSGLEHLAPTHAPSRSFSEEDIVLPNGHFNIHGATYMIVDTALRIPSVHPEGSTADIPVIPPIPWMPASEDPTVELSRSTDPIYTPIADYCETGTNTFAALDECRVDIDRLQALGWDEWDQSYYQSYIA